MSRPEFGKMFSEDLHRPGVQDQVGGPAFPIQRRDEAIAEFDQDEQLSPGFLQFVQTADEQFMNSNYDQARRLYISALKEPHMEGQVLFNVYKNLGNIAMHEGDLDGAEEFYNKAYTMNPDSDVLLVNYGSLAIHRGQLDVAVRHFRQAVAINSRNEKAWTGLAMIHRGFGDSELAWANIESALDINPGNGTAIRLVAEWGLKDNELERSVRLMEMYLARQSKDALIHLMQSKFLFFFGRLEESLFHVRKALSLEPGIEDGSDLLAIIQDELASRVSRFK